VSDYANILLRNFACRKIVFRVIHNLLNQKFIPERLKRRCQPAVPVVPESGYVTDKTSVRKRAE